MRWIISNVLGVQNWCDDNDEKESGTDMNEKTISTVMWCLLAFAVLVPIVVLAVYGIKLGPVSSQTTDWGSFGSVMGGAFTLLSALATIATLLHLYGQQKKAEVRQNAKDIENEKAQKNHDNVVKKQISALTFEQYLKHQSAFLERINKMELGFKSKILFSNPEKLYRDIFPNNSPSYCSYTTELAEGDDKSLGFISNINEVCEKINYYLGYHPDNTDIYKLVSHLYELQEKLAITYQEKEKEGDVFFAGQKIGLNIYDVYSLILDIQKAVNFVMFFSGRKEIALERKFLILLGDSIYRKILEDERIGKIIHIYNEIPEVPKLYEICDFLCENNITLMNSYNKVKLLFVSREMVMQLKNKKYLNEVLGEVEKDISSNGDRIKNRDGLERIKDLLLELRSGSHDQDGSV